MLRSFKQAPRPPGLLRVLHTETLAEEWPAFERLLCQHFRYCRRIPLPERQAEDVGEARWPTLTELFPAQPPPPWLRRFRACYAADFAAFNYSTDPRILKHGTPSGKRKRPPP